MKIIKLEDSNFLVRNIFLCLKQVYCCLTFVCVYIWDKQVEGSCLNNCSTNKLEAQGPFIAHLTTKSKQFSQKKRQPEWQNSNKCMCRQQYISMLLWTFGLKEDFVKGEALPLHIFAPPWIRPLEYLAETTTRMAAFQVKHFVFEALFDFLPCLRSTPGWIW